MSRGPLVHGRYVPGSLGFLLQLLRQRPRVHIMPRWRSICAAQSVSAVNGARGLDGVASTARCAGRARYRSVCRSYTGVTLTTLTGPRRSTSVANGYCRFSRSELHIGISQMKSPQSRVGRIDIGRATCGIVAAWLLLGMRMVAAWPRDDGVLCGT